MLNTPNPIHWITTVIQDARKLQALEKYQTTSALRAAPISPEERAAVLEALTRVAPGVDFEWSSSRHEVRA